ncbi:hypothetical protein MFLO_15805 [Listeria floridensis FSL S10-1187]|uniref:Lipoprotein n=1 Tax=Listeria floridensis FSL S10-1187 TaxID=1265817 RepID=A0ABN0RBA4_9LIST|nr:hypothetical protein [Listeria floridensis]EUJ23746.1 hypothetical protein MFLO_15805 [Listeria floridensis FSL S10-1187]
MVLVGNEAYSSLTEKVSTSSTGDIKKFTYLKSGEPAKIVKALPPNKIAAYDSYSVFGKVNSFEAENPSIKNARGYAIDELTTWDLASKFYQDQASELIEKGKSKEDDDVKALRTEAAKYRSKRRYIVPFVDLNSGELIYVDFSKNQMKNVNSIVEKQHAKNKLNKLAFELEKTGEGRDTVVSLTPVIDADDLTKEQQEHLKNVNIEEQAPDFEGLTFVCDEAQQIEKLTEAGFDVKLIGLNPNTTETDPTEEF